MDEVSFKKIADDERRLSQIVMYVLSTTIFAIILAIFVVFNTRQDVGGIAALTSFLYLLGFLLLCDRKFLAFRIIKTESFFEKIGNERLVLRFQYMKLLYRKFLRFLIYVISFSSIMLYFISLTQASVALVTLFQEFFIEIVFVPTMMIFSVYYYRKLFTKFYDFYYYFSSGCFKMIQSLSFMTEVDKIKYTMMALKYYDYYIRKNYNLRINNLERAYSKIISTSTDSMNAILNNIIEIMQGSSKLDFLRYLEEHIGDKIHPL